jgi:hypothetical protein
MAEWFGKYENPYIEWFNHFLAAHKQNKSGL